MFNRLKRGVEDRGWEGEKDGMEEEGKEREEGKHIVTCGLKSSVPIMLTLLVCT
jgi:hypothetical protein